MPIYLITKIVLTLITRIALMRNEKLDDRVYRRRDERGAALITTLLLSALLLAAGGTLILTTAMTGTTAVESTAEMQAYYAAEAGVASVLNVVRGNVESNPAGTRASFRNVVCTDTQGRWTATSGNAVNVTANGSTRFQVTSIVDPDNTVVDPCSVALYKPNRLVIQVAGFGPRNSRKNMEIVINRLTLNYSVPAAVNGRNQSGTPSPVSFGESNSTSISGVDAYGNPSPSVGAIAIDSQDLSTTQNVINGCHPDGSTCGGSTPNITPSTASVLTSSTTPNFLTSVSATRDFLYGTNPGMKAMAMRQGRYFTGGAAAMSSAAGLGANLPDGILTFVDGDLVLGPGNPTGKGTLIVTGDLTLDGNFNFNGVIMVLGAGRVFRSGAGNGNIYGALFIAKFAPTGDNTDLFGAFTFDTSGGGTANIQYNSDWIDRAKSVGGHNVVGVREF
jgi:hypothetical protein